MDLEYGVFVGSLNENEMLSVEGIKRAYTVDILLAVICSIIQLLYRQTA